MKGRSPKRRRTNILTSFQNDQLERQNYTRRTRNASLKSLHGELHHVLRPLITHAKKSSAPSETQALENAQNGRGPFLRAVRGSACALRRGPEEKRSRDCGGWMTDIQKLIFPRRSFCRHPHFISRRPRRHGLGLGFIMGRWETPPRIPPGLPY